MANPQIENGFTKIANELLTELSKKFPDNKAKLFFCILRNTYGWNRKEAALTLSRLATETGIMRHHIPGLLKTLEQSKFIEITKMNSGNLISIQKNHDCWGVTNSGSTKIGTTEIGTTEIGSTCSTEIGTGGGTEIGTGNDQETPGLILAGENLKKALKKDKESIAETDKNSSLDKPNPKRTTNLTDAGFIAQLKANVAYQGIDIDRELGKAQAWLLTKPGRLCTRKFFINWLNRADKPMQNTATIDINDQILASYGDS